MSESPFEDRNSPLAKNKDSGPRPLSESSIERGDGYVIFSPEDPEVGGTRIILKWGGNPPEKNKQPDLKGGGGKGKDKGEEEDGESEGGSGEGKEKGGEGGKSQGGEEQGGEKDLRVLPHSRTPAILSKTRLRMRLWTSRMRFTRATRPQ